MTMNAKYTIPLVLSISALALAGCATAQQRRDYEAGQKAAAEGRIIAQQALEAVKGIKPRAP